MLITKILTEYLRRVIRNYKIYTVSILGMGVAIIASFHIYHFVYKELSVDKFHEKRGEVYRVIEKRDNANFSSSDTPPPLGQLLQEKLPEVKNYARIMNDPLEVALQADANSHKAVVSYIDATFFELFDFSLKKGNISHFEESANGIIISEKAEKLLFGNRESLGRVITVSQDYKKEKESFEVIGVINSIPEASTIQGDYFINIKSREPNPSNVMSWVGATGVDLYLHMPLLKNPELFSKKASELMFDKMKMGFKNLTGEDVNDVYFQLSLQRLDSIYFNSEDIRNQKKKGNPQFIKIVVLVGLLSLFLAVTNYIIMNLGLNMSRSREFKTRYFLGASKKEIYRQFLIESCLNSIICFMLALLTYPFFGKLISKIIGFNYQLSIIGDGILLFSFLLVLFLIGLLIGSLEFILSYRKIFLSTEKTIDHSKKSEKFIIGFQLFLFIGLIISMLFIGKQVNYILNKDLGYDPDQVVSISTRNHKDLKGFLDAKSYIKSTSYSQLLFSPVFQLGQLQNVETNDKVEAIFKQADHNYLKVNDITLLYGENFSGRENTLNPNGASPSNKKLTEILVNEEFVRKANLKDPVGKIFKVENYMEFVIVGVIENVYAAPLYYPVQPLIIATVDYNGWYYGSLTANYEKGYKDQLKNDVKDFFATKGVESVFLDDVLFQYDLNDIYKKELQLKRLLEAFTIIVLFISLLGLVAISLFITESKTKEIGIRKVNGATINQIMLMLNRDFIKWVAIAFVIACPIAYYAMHKWLENFAYKTELSWWVFALAGIFTLVIALLTVSWQTYRAATRNPVESIRTE